MDTNNDPFITIPLTELLDLALGYGCLESQRISDTLSEILQIKKQELCSVQIADKDGNKLQHPRIWRRKEYLESAQKWEADKARSQREREERFIFQANVFRVAEVLRKEFEMDQKRSIETASELLKRKNRELITTIGIKSLIASMSEL